MPGFPLARLVADSDVSAVDAVVLRNHGLFTFDDDADQALARHRALVASATAHLGVEAWGESGETATSVGTVLELAKLRRDISLAAGHPMLLRQTRSARAAAFAARDDVARLTSRGTATPEHVIHTSAPRSSDAMSKGMRNVTASTSSDTAPAHKVLWPSSTLLRA